ncbi:Methyltransferase domain-containing protein [Sphingobium faniae]|nr:Methyltransferase domain-containing protein [Sphingobium faniae]
MRETPYSFTCVLCGSANDGDIVQEKINGDAIGEMVAISCPDCRHVQLFPPQYDMAYYDNDDQINNVVKQYGTLPETLFHHSFIEARRRKDRFAAVGIDIHADGLNILDIGGGYGFFGGELATSLPRSSVTLLEPSAKRVAMGAERMRAEGIVPPQSQVGLLDERFAAEHEAAFDIVTLWHVLEHVPDPVGLLRLAMKIVKPSGVLCIEVPNLDDDTISLSDGFRNRWFMQEHISYFSPETLKSTALRAMPEARLEAHGYQRYGIFNQMNWIHFDKPLGADPDLFEGTDRYWLETHWRSEKERTLTSDALFMVMRHPA